MEVPERQLHQVEEKTTIAKWLWSSASTGVETCCCNFLPIYLLTK